MERVLIAGGIGLAPARCAPAATALHLVAREADRLRSAAEDLGNTTVTAGDVADPGLFPRVAEETGDRLDGLVFAVGTITLAPVQKVTADTALDDFRINALGAFLAVQAAARALKAGAGEAGAGVVLFSTVAVAQGFLHHASVAMAKGAVEGLALCWPPSSPEDPRERGGAHADAHAEGITRNETLASGIAAMHALQRLCTPEDVAALAAFLVGPDAAYITGQIVGVDGGRSRLRTKD